MRRCDDRAVAQCARRHVICSLEPARSGHVLYNDRRIARDVFLQDLRQEPRIGVVGAARIGGDHEAELFALVEIALRPRARARKPSGHPQGRQSDEAKLHSLPPFANMLSQSFGECIMRRQVTAMDGAWTMAQASAYHHTNRSQEGTTMAT